MPYNWQQDEWPTFRYDLASFRADLLVIAERFGRIRGLVEGLPDGQEEETVLHLMISEAVKSSAIEGEVLQYGEVMSSIRNKLGLNPRPEPVQSALARGSGELMVAVRSGFSSPLDEETLFSWHRTLFGESSPLRVGEWRGESAPMRVVSGRVDKPVVHFEAPPGGEVPREMAAFIQWFNDTAPGGKTPIVDAPVRSAITHLYFETIHPFEDGNGRIGRALAEKALSQGMGAPVVLSLSQAIQARRGDYYEALKAAQRGNEITPWIGYFIRTVLAAQADAEARIMFSVRTAKFFQRHAGELNDRQMKMLRRVLSSGPEGFEGGINVRKYMAVTRASKATATRDLQHLATIRALEATGHGRAIRYEIVLNPGC